MASSLNVLKKKLYNNETFILFTPPGIPKHKSAGITLLKYILAEKKTPVVYICTDTPFINIKKILDNEQIDMKPAIFIDTVSMMSGKKIDSPNCIYIRSPENLTDMSIALSEALSSLTPNRTCVILDSLSTLLLYNKSNTILKFVHVVLTKVKQYTGKCFVLSAKKNDAFTNEVLRFFDCSIDYSGG